MAANPATAPMIRRSVRRIVFEAVEPATGSTVIAPPFQIICFLDSIETGFGGAALDVDGAFLSFPGPPLLPPSPPVREACQDCRSSSLRRADFQPCCGAQGLPGACPWRTLSG